MVNYSLSIKGKETQWLFFNCVEFSSFQCGCKVLIIVRISGEISRSEVGRKEACA